MVEEIPNPLAVQVLGKGDKQQLAQLRPSVESAVSLYTPASGIIAEVHCLFVTNTTAGGITFRFFHDDDGTTFDQSTALIWNSTVVVGAFTTLTFDTPIYLLNDAGNLGVRTSVANGLTFTLYGQEFSRSK